jgi:hypothetical protein
MMWEIEPSAAKTGLLSGLQCRSSNPPPSGLRVAGDCQYKPI